MAQCGRHNAVKCFLTATLCTKVTIEEKHKKSSVTDRVKKRIRELHILIWINDKVKVTEIYNMSGTSVILRPCHSWEKSLIGTKNHVPKSYIT